MTSSQYLAVAAAVVAGAAGQDQDVVDLLEHAPRGCAGSPCTCAVEQLGHDAFHAFERVGNGARLLEDFLLHVVAIRAQLGRAAVRRHGAHGALGRRQRLARGRRPGPRSSSGPAAGPPGHPLPGTRSDRSRPPGPWRRWPGSARSRLVAHAQDERRAMRAPTTRCGFVLVDDGNGVGAGQAGHSGLAPPRTGRPGTGCPPGGR